MGNHLDEDEDDNMLVILLDDFLEKEWSGTSTELTKELKKLDENFSISPVTLTKQLKANTGLFKNEFSIAIDFERTGKSRRILLRRTDK